MTEVRTPLSPAPDVAGDVGGDPFTPTRLLPVDASTVPSDRSRRVSRNDVVRIAGYGLTLFGLVAVFYLVFIFGISRLEHGRAQDRLVTTLRKQLALAEAPIGARIPLGTPVALLDIPRLHVQEAVVEGTTGELLKLGPGHLRNSPLPGQRGNVVIMGRRAAYGAPFGQLSRLRAGDEISATTGQGRAVYVVTRVREANRAGTDVVDDPNGNQLTLTTSAPLLLAERRLVATATLETGVVPTPLGRPVEVDRRELGLQADGSGVLPLLLWSELLLVAACAAAWLYRRWSRWSAYLVTTPILALLLLQVFDNVTSILPSTT
jgi:LPXTG-site transpeptidase (sortase) family protein